MARMLKGAKPYKPVKIAAVKGEPQPPVVKAKIIKGRYKKSSAAKKVQALPVASQDVGRFKGKF